jgi:DNA-binding NarL/FixJ family response regulator
MSTTPANRGAALAKTRPELTANLSEAQVKVLEYLLEGYTEPQIAEQISRSRHTVHDHTKAIYQALGVNGRVQLVLMFANQSG